MSKDEDTLIENILCVLIALGFVLGALLYW